MRAKSQLANGLTLLRVALVPFFVLALLGRSALSGALALAFFAAAALSDYFDGKIARKLGTGSRFGEFLDPLADKILTGSAFVAFAFMPSLRVPLWLVLIIIAREALLTVLRAAAFRTPRSIKAEFTGKLKTAVQMFSIACILLLLAADKAERAGWTIMRGADAGGALPPAAPAAGLFDLPAVRAIPLVLVSLSALASLASLAGYLGKTGRASPAGPAGAGGRSMWRTTLDFSVRFASSVCYIGFLPRGAGTAASLAGVAACVFLPRGWWHVLAVGLAIAVGTAASEYAEKRLYAEKDSGMIVIDEFAGVLVTFVTFPFRFTPAGAAVCLLGLVLFRVFDILKPFPIGALQKVRGGPGVVLDDVASGIAANAVLQLLRLAVPRLFS